MGFQLFPEHIAGPGNASADRFWEPAGRAAFVAVATLLSETPDEALTMSNVLRVFTRGDGIEWLARQIEMRRDTPRRYSRVVADGVSDYINGDIRQVDGIRKTVTTRLQVWHNPRIAAATAASDFDMRDLRRQPMTIYVAVAPGDIPRMAPLLRLFFDQFINLNTVKTPQQDPTISVQTLVLLDEFARLGRVDCLSHAAQFVRSYGMRLAFVVQNKAQLRELYGQHGAADIFDNLGAEVVFGTGDLELAQELEKRLGDATVNVITQNRPRWFAWFNLSRQTDAEHPHRRPLLLAQEVLQMPAGDLIILRPGMRPARARKIQGGTSARLPIAGCRRRRSPICTSTLPWTTAARRSSGRFHAPCRASRDPTSKTAERHVPTPEERITRWEQRQELIIASMNRMVDTMEVIRDMIGELAAWLKQPASSDLSDLLKVLILRAETVSDEMVQLGGKMDALPATIVRAMHTGEVE